MQEFIRQQALSLGFDACGFARAEYLSEDAAFLRKWLDEEMHGSMKFLENNFEKRVDPTQLVPGCKTVVVVLLNYYPQVEQPSDSPKIARYAYSAVDYHYVIRQKLHELENAITDAYGADVVSGEYQHSFVDSAPVLERRWAQLAGLGWIGKHKQLIADQLGSYCFIGTLFLNIELEPASISRNKCGSCTKCIDACPTNALDNGILDARKCISYLTIENREEISEQFRDKLSGCVVGCDICQDVCPWNRKWAKPHNHSELTPMEEVLSWKNSEWTSVTSSDFKRKFRNSALNRVGLKKLKSNIDIEKKQRI